MDCMLYPRGSHPGRRRDSSHVQGEGPQRSGRLPVRQALGHDRAGLLRGLVADSEISARLRAHSLAAGVSRLRGGCPASRAPTLPTVSFQKNRTQIKQDQTQQLTVVLARLQLARHEMVAEVEQNLREAIEFHLEGMRLHGDPIPEPSARSFFFEIAA